MCDDACFCTLCPVNLVMGNFTRLETDNLFMVYGYYKLLEEYGKEET